MPDVEETIGTALAKLDGKIDLLSSKLDSHRDLLIAKMEAGDRESGQAIALTNERVAGLAGKVQENLTRILTVEANLDEMADKVEPVPLLKNLVYGFVALCLVAIVTGLLALVLQGGK